MIEQLFRQTRAPFVIVRNQRLHIGDQTYEQLISKQKTILRWGFYLGLLVWLLAFGESGAEDFIYFRF